MTTSIYTDGSCLKPQGAGGFAFIILKNDDEYHYAEGADITTNNRMEMMAVISSLTFVSNDEVFRGDNFIIYSDSQLVINCAIGKWKRNKNLDLWAEYDKISKNMNITFEWVKAHAGNKYNEMVDTMARNEAREIMANAPSAK